jgi:hypothetical protein
VRGQRGGRQHPRQKHRPIVRRRMLLLRQRLPQPPGR